MRVETVVKWITEDILKWTDQDPEIARQVVAMLTSFDWQQVMINHQQAEVDSQLTSMSFFIHQIEEGRGFCDDCEESNYVGGYHHSPLHERVYSWPHRQSPSSHYGVEFTQGQLYCWQCFYKLQENSEKWQMLEYKIKHPDLPKGAYLKWPGKMHICHECERLIPSKVGYSIAQDTYSRSYCLHCIEKVVNRTFTACMECGKKTTSPIRGMCYDCYDLCAKYPSSSLSTHLERARKAGNPATLTAKQWAMAIEYFGGGCAYCRVRPFEVLEHFLPIVLGGGTTAENCVPSCHRCNCLKGSAHPDSFDHIFPHDVIEHIKEYLQGDKQQKVSSLAVKCRALMVI